MKQILWIIAAIVIITSALIYINQSTTFDEAMELIRQDDINRHNESVRQQLEDQNNWEKY